jgi:hypothetical protein
MKKATPEEIRQAFAEVDRLADQLHDAAATLYVMIAHSSAPNVCAMTTLDLRQATGLVASMKLNTRVHIEKWLIDLPPRVSRKVKRGVK